MLLSRNLTIGLVSVIVLAVLAVAVSVKVMGNNDNNNNSGSESFDYPFLSQNRTVKFAGSSKLMVLVNSNDNLIRQISTVYGVNAQCINETDESKSVVSAKSACEDGHHIIAVNIGYSNVSNLLPYTDLAKEYDYLYVLAVEPETLLPTYVGWHVPYMDSHQLGRMAHTFQENLLRTVSEFFYDFHNFSQKATIPEMIEFYELASSNYHGMLHCTAQYLGSNPSVASQEYFRVVKHNISEFYETAIIGLVFTPRTFGARVKLTPCQLKLWGGDEESSQVQLNEEPLNPNLPSSVVEENLLTSVCSELSVLAVKSELDVEREDQKSVSSLDENLSSLKDKESPADILSGKPDFRPVTGRGRRAHMTLGVAPGVSAVTTGTDLLQVVQCESEDRDWPTYEGELGWLRNYGEGRWVLYFRKHIRVGTLFTGVY